MSAPPKAAAVILTAQLLRSLPVQWTQWAITHQLTSYAQTRDLSVQWAPHLPRAMRPYAAAYDEMQAWLNSHLVCIRHQEHAVYAEYEIVMLPQRPPTQDVVDAWTDPVDIPTMAAGAVGALGWALPQVAIIDFLGLNDAVVAWNPELNPGRRMSHERHAPAGYVESFRPNVTVRRAQLTIAPREDPLDPVEVEAIERLWWTRMGLAR